MVGVEIQLPMFDVEIQLPKLGVEIHSPMFDVEIQLSMFDVEIQLSMFDVEIQLRMFDVEILLPMFNVEIQLHIGLGSVPYLSPPLPRPSTLNPVYVFCKCIHAWHPLVWLDLSFSFSFLSWFGSV